MKTINIILKLSAYILAIGTMTAVLFLDEKDYAHFAYNMAIAIWCYILSETAEKHS